LDYIPLVSTVSGVARVAFGFLQTVLGIVMAPVQIGQRVLGHNKSRFLFNIGISNIVRGDIASAPFIGNFVIYVYDHLPHIKMDVQHLFGLAKYSEWSDPSLSKGISNPKK
jgi:hypothetical protein